MPILLTLALGVADCTFIFQTYIGLINAAGVGATVAAANGAAGQDISSIVLHEADSNMTRCATRSVDTPTFVADGETGYYKVTVTVHCQMKDLTGFFQNINLTWSAARRTTRSK